MRHTACVSRACICAGLVQEMSAGRDKVHYLEDGLLDDLRVDVGHTIDSLAANHSQVCHVHQPTQHKQPKWVGRPGVYKALGKQ